MPRRQVHRYDDIVRRFEAAARNSLSVPVNIRDLCQVADVNERTVLRAIRAVHGTTTCHYLRALRLTEARQALLCTDTPAATVTEVALSFGFRELGRFAVEYRARFGESPSDTLYRTVGTSRDSDP